MRKHSFPLQSVTLTVDSVASFDAVLLVTNHDAFDYSLIGSSSKLLIDTRGRFAPAHNILRA